MNPDVFVHSLAVNESRQVGPGTRIWAFAHVMDGAVIGSRCNIGEQCFIEGGAVIGNGVTVKNGVSVWSGVVLEDFVFVGPAAVFTNDLTPRSPRDPENAGKYSKDWLTGTRICLGASIGANATIVCGNTVGTYAMVAAGAVVTRDVFPHQLVAGCPAVPIGYVCICGKRLLWPEKKNCDTCGRHYEIDGDSIRKKM